MIKRPVRASNYMHVQGAAWQRASHGTCLATTNREGGRERESDRESCSKREIRGKRGRERVTGREGKAKLLKMECEQQKCTEKLGTMMLRIAHLIPFYYGNSHIVKKNSVRR